MEERRLLVAVALSLLILTGYSLLFGPRGRPPAEEPAPTTAIATPSPSPPIEPSVSAPRESVPETPSAEAKPVPTEAAEREYRVEVVGEDYSVAFSNRGARVLSWKLARYHDRDGRPEEMVSGASTGLRPLDLETGDETLDERLRTALFIPSAETLRVGGASPRTLSFRYADGALEAEKSLTFQTGGLVAVMATVRSGGQPVPCRLVWGPGLGNPSEEAKSVRGYEEPKGVALVGGDVERFAPAKLEAGGTPLAAVRWAGVESTYFAALFVPAEDVAPAVIRPEKLPAGPDEKATVATATLIDTSSSAPILLYVGPKDYGALKRLGFGLERVVPVGDWIGPIVVPLMRLLRWVHAQVGNWGWAIVLITILINVVMAPLRHYSIANSMKMAKMQPEMKVIQERYRKVPMMDPRRQKMQEEMAALYARHGMSMGTQMLMGCLPLLLTMPFLFAFYRVLRISIELRGAPFLWIPDLSQKDPLFITPVAMGVSMYAMQKVTPTTMDPSQQRIMMLMPIMLAGMFLWAPGGLNLYWLTANLWSLFQQTLEMRILRPEVRPAPGKTKEIASKRGRGKR